MKLRFSHGVLCVLLGSAFAVVPPSYAADFYVDPVNGSMSNDGSSAHPWRTLQEVFAANRIESREFASNPPGPGTPFMVKNAGAPVKAGDTLYLRTGYHGRIAVDGYYNSNYITVQAQPGQQPTLSNLSLTSAAKWVFKGLTISPSLAPVSNSDTLVEFADHNWTGNSYDCTLESCTLYSVWDSAAWTANDWINHACDGINLNGNSLVARGNYIKNVRFGIMAGQFCLIDSNVIENFSGDGLRGWDYSVFQYNVVKNCYAGEADGDDNHDDAFQSWSSGINPGTGQEEVGYGTVYGVVLRGNTIINFTDPGQPFRSELQGIGCFDGLYQDWIIENNVIITDHWHGISLYGAVNCKILNNTVIDAEAGSPGPPWIMITAHKRGIPSSGCLVRNNLATAFDLSGTGNVTDHNTQITESQLPAYFVLPRLNLHLRAGSPAIDAGSGTGAPVLDLDKTSRPLGAGWDLGAYERDPGNIAPPAPPRGLRLAL